MERFDTLQHTGYEADSRKDTDPALLVFILDTNPTAWAALTEPTLQNCLLEILVFINAHLALNHRNLTAVIASHTDKARFLYPSPHTSSHLMPHAQTKSFDAAREANSYKPFLTLQDTVVRNLQSLLQSTTEASIEKSSSSMMSGAITLALSYINRQSTLHADTHLKSRIMILSVSGDLAFQYIPMMNCIFSAQKQKVLIDIAKIGGDAVFLQQASDATGGIYRNIDPPRESLLQTLLMLFLPDQPVRELLNTPDLLNNVDFRAACFCHKRVLDIGFVCSVCLSIFCSPLPKCITCDAAFDMQELKAFGAKPAVSLRRKKVANAASGTAATKTPTIAHEDSIVID